MRDRIMFNVASSLNEKKNNLIVKAANTITSLMEKNVTGKLGIGNVGGMTIVKNNRRINEIISETSKICELLDKELCELQTRDKPKVDAL